ncbi:MAG: hypothetical protein AAF466_03165 [Bacteroidota bacterium]
MKKLISPLTVFALLLMIPIAYLFFDSSADLQSSGAGFLWIGLFALGVLAGSMLLLDIILRRFVKNYSNFLWIEFGVVLIVVVFLLLN